MAINERLIHTAADAAGAAGAGTGNQEEGLILHLDANDVDSYDGDGTVWYDIKDHEYTPATNADEHFNTVTYTGASAPHVINTVGFQPDLIWIKNRDTTDSYAIVDSVRGITSPTPYLASDQIAAQATSTNMPTSVQPEGFTITGNGGRTNTIGEDYVAWCFKAGGAAVLNEEGSIDSQVSANNDLGFSIATYTGVGYPASSTAEIGHGLDTAPELVIIKGTGGTGQSGGAGSWVVGSSLLGAGWDGSLYLNSQNEYYSAINYFWNGKATSSVIKLKNDWFVNGSNNQYVAYCFTSKRGVSKVGSYKGKTGSVKVYTGFEPAFILIKKTNTSTNGNWSIFDNARVNETVKGQLYPSLNIAENDRDGLISFNGDGFTLENNTVGEVNTNGDSYIYYAVAKNTKETSLIPNTDLELHLDAGDDDSTSSNWQDLSSNDYTATFTGITYDEELGNSYNFVGGSSEVLLNDGGSLTNNANFTVEMWLNSTDNSDYQNFWGNMNNAGGARQIYARMELNDKIEITAYSSNDSNNYRQVKTTSEVGSKIYGKWTHLSIVMSSQKITGVYINGESEPITTTVGDSLLMHLTSTTNFGIGGHQNTGTGISFNGNIGQVRMYHSALTQDQIRQNYNFTKNNYPNGINASLTNVSWNANYFEMDSSSDAIEFGDGLKPYLDGLTTVLSASYWIRFDDLDATQHLFAYYNSSLGGDSMGFSQGMVESGKLQWYITPTSGTTYARTTSVCVTPNTWYHVVMVLDMSKSQTNGTGGRVQIFVDGTEQSITYVEATGSTTLKTGSASLKPSFGFTTNSGGTKENHFDGRVSKIKIFDKALTQAKVTALYNEGE